ncbi:pyridoxamine 5'-phosphate oxidase family protein [Streptomyces albiaxialis]|uniref:Pyridoxamine 5'-phosphate oxidase family protein n=1 Tax=Streptomyces albiaxialis TaxID=329523 RepID=A0ABP5I8T5_9ACTN
MTRFARIAYTPSVRAAQEENGSALAARRRLGPDQGREESDPLGPDEAAFLTAADGFYLATVGETGWPYMQYRGGPPGFLHVLDPGTLAFTDVRGNRQYITTGNARSNDRVALFVMNYAARARLKLYGRLSVRTLDEDPALTHTLAEPRTDGRPERHLVIAVEGWNWNCPQHITPRFSEREVSAALAPVRERMRLLEEENEDLRARLERYTERAEAAG